MKPHSEAAFETAIEDYLLTHGGYEKGDPGAFHRTRCLDTGVLLAFIKETQPKEWDYLRGILTEKAEETLLDELCRALDSPYEGCIGQFHGKFRVQVSVRT